VWGDGEAKQATAESCKETTYRFIPRIAGDGSVPPETREAKPMSYKTKAAKRAQRKAVKRKAGTVLEHKNILWRGDVAEKAERERYYDRKYSSREVRAMRNDQRRLKRDGAGR
jgi:hypothetical protein